MLLGMINDILDLAKIESGKMEVRSEDFSIRDVCEALVSLARPIAERKNIDLECRLDEAIPLLRQDSGKLRQILYTANSAPLGTNAASNYGRYSNPEVDQAFDAYASADAVTDRPSVIFAYTIKAWRLATEGHPGNHSALLSAAQSEALARETGADPADPWARFFKIKQRLP